MTLMRYVLAALTLLALPLAEAEAQSRIRFEPGSDSGSASGTITGYETRDYRVGAMAGQTLTVTFTSDNRSASFNLLPPGSEEAIFIGSIAGDRFAGKLPTSGDYVIRIGMMRSAARRNETAHYTLSVRITAAAGSWRDPVKNDFADSLAGGPDEWRVVGVPAGDRLNIRTKPYPSAPIVKRVPNGTRLANRGCRMVSGSRWCKVEGLGNPPLSGWANGRYLRE